MLAERYFHKLREVLDRIEATQIENIRRAAEMIVESVKAGGCVHLLDTGHMLAHEAVGRAGGLMMMTPVRFNVEVANPARPRGLPAKPRIFADEIQGLSDYVLSSSSIYPGDVLIVGSVSGKNALPVDVALKAQAMGVKVVAITSVEYSKALPSRHPSGKRLYEVADVVIDNCGAVGDAAVDVPGLDVSICPTSGIAAAHIIWALTAEIVERLMACGIKPSVYKSNHAPGASQHNAEAQAAFLKTGF